MRGQEVTYAFIDECNPIVFDEKEMKRLIKKYGVKNFGIEYTKPKKDSIEVNIEKGTELIYKGNLFEFTKDKTYKVDDIKGFYIYIKNDVRDLIGFDFQEIEEEFYIKPKKDPIVKQVTDKFKARSKVGIEKYGTTLEENNTDDFLTHLEEEMMDSLLYIQKLKSQKDYSLQAKHNELIQQFDKLKKEQLEYFSEVELINHLGKKGYSITIKREL